jgi:hypothetical protein
MKLTKILQESSLSRIWKHTKEHDSGTITAFRYAPDCGNGTPYTKSQNQQRNAQLKAKLLSLGYGVTAIDGYYIENYKSENERKVKEESFIVIDIKDKGTLKNDLVKLGLFFEQDSVTYGTPDGAYYLVSSNKCPSGYPGKGKVGVSVKLGKPLFGQNGEFFSSVGGRPFVFTEVKHDIQELTSFYPTEIRSLKALANEIKLSEINLEVL